MRQFNMAVAAALTCASLALGACEGDGLSTVADIYTKGGETAVKATAIGLNTECARSIDSRRTFVADINAKQQEKGKTARAIAQDCNGDGQPDF